MAKVHPMREWGGELRNIQLRADGELPAGVCGRVTGILLRYGVVDSYRTMFARGCLDATRSKVAAGRVPLFGNSAMAAGTHIHGTRTHVGTIRALEDVGDEVVMSADLFDTPAGRETKQYLETVLLTKSTTGLSAGFRERQACIVDAMEDGEKIRALRFDEIELMEGTVVPLAAVPGADVLAVRATPELAESALRSLLAVVPRDRVDALLQEAEAVPAAVAANADTPPELRAAPSDTPAPGSVVATAEERIAAFRRLYAPTSA